MSGTSDKLTVMLEGEAANLDKHLFLDGIKFGLDSCAEIAAQIKAGHYYYIALAITIATAVASAIASAIASVIASAVATVVAETIYLA